MAKLKSSLSLIAALAAAFAISSCAMAETIPIPENLIKTYEETVDVPDASAEDLFKKIRFYVIENLDKDFFEDSYQCTITHTAGSAPKRECAKATDWESKIKDIFDEGNNHIVFKPKKEYAGLIKPKPKVTRIEIFVNSGQYRVIGVLESIYAKYGEIEKALQESLPGVEQDWKSFNAEMKQAITEQITDEEFENLMQKGRLAVKTHMSNPLGDIKSVEDAKKMFLKAAIAKPNNAKAINNYGLCFASLGEDDIHVAARVGLGPPRKAVSYLNRALYILGFVPKGDPEVDQIIQESVSNALQLKQKAEQEVNRARL
jgi:hypothetical protein